MVFSTVLAGRELDRDELREAVRAGPPALRPDDDHPAMLERVGFVGVGEIDVTDRYRATARAWLERAAEVAEELSEAEGADVFRQQQEDRRCALEAIEAGLLRRSLFVGEILS